MTTPREWIEDFAARLGVEPPTPEETEVLLELAGVAARASERVAAPIACFLVGRAAAAPTAALATARDL